MPQYSRFVMVVIAALVVITVTSRSADATCFEALAFVRVTLTLAYASYCPPALSADQ